MSPTPGEYKEFQRNWADDDLQKITTPVWIVEGDHDEAIKRENTEFMAVNIPGAGLMLQPQISHFSPGHGAILG